MCQGDTHTAAVFLPTRPCSRLSLSNRVTFFFLLLLQANNPLSEQGRRDKYTERLLEYDECCSMRDIIQHEYQTTPLPRVGHRDDDFELMVAKFDNIGNLDMNRFVR